MKKNVLDCHIAQDRLIVYKRSNKKEKKAVFINISKVTIKEIENLK